MSRKKRGPELKIVPVEQAVGLKGLHDMTRIIPENVKGPVFKSGQTITVEDVGILA